MRRSSYVAGGRTFGKGETNSVFHLVGKVPDAMLLQKISWMGFDNSGRNSFINEIGKSEGTEEVFFDVCRILYTSCSSGKQGTSETNGVFGGGINGMADLLTGVKCPLIAAKKLAISSVMLLSEFSS